MPVIFFGVALDPDDTKEKSIIKRAYLNALLRGRIPDPNFLSPYDALTYYLRDIFLNQKYIKAGEVSIDTWLTPKPKVSDLPMINPESYSAFLDVDGCRDYAEIVNNFVERKALPNKFVMLGVDHSSTGGVLKALSNFYGPENLGVIILDAHFDGLHARLGKEWYDYAKERDIPIFTNFSHTSETTELENPETYTCGSFLRYVIKEKIVFPQNVKLIGVSDYPSARLMEIDDARVKNYVKSYMQFEKKGVTFVSKAKIKKVGVEDALKPALDMLEMPYVYISLDIDIGSFRGVYAARIMNMIGLDPEEIYEILYRAKKKIMVKNLVGFDVMEIEIHSAGARLKSGIVDKTYQIAGNCIKILLNGL